MLHEYHKHRSVGMTTDIITYPDGRVEVIKGHNRIVHGFNILVSGLLKGEPLKGFQYWAVGSGEDSWGVSAVRTKVKVTLIGTASQDDTIYLYLDDMPYPISVLLGDTSDIIASKIYSSDFPAWEVELEDSTLTFTSKLGGAREGEFKLVNASNLNATFEEVVKGVDATEIPVPNGKETKLVNEIYRKEILPENISFIDPETGEKTEEYTNIIEIAVKFELPEAVGDWREFSLFGGNATEAKDSGIAINYRTHDRIPKSSSMSIERIIRFTFE